MRRQPMIAAGATPRVWTRFDVLLFAVASGIMLSFIWRMQSLYPPWAAIQGPSIITGVGVLLVVVGGRLRLVGARVRQPTALAVLGILAMVAVSIPGSLYPGLSFNFLFEDFAKTVLLMAVVLAAIRRIEHLERLALVFVLGAAWYSLYTFLNFQVQSSGRLGRLIYYDSNDLALWLVVALPLAAHFVLRPTSRWVRIAGMASLPLILVVFAQTGSRGGFLGLVAVVGYMLLGYRQFSPGRRVGVALALFFGLALVASDTYWDLMATLLDPTSDYNWSGTATGGGRMNIWRRGLGYMVSDPLTGVGARAFPVAEGTLSPLAVRQEYGIGLKWSAAHNSFVQIGAELGILGLIAFVAAIGTALRSLSRVANRSTHSGAVSLARALSASLVGYCAAGFFLSQAYGSGLYLLLALAIALAAIAPAIPGTAVAPRRVRPRRATRAAVAHQRAAARPRRFPRESASAGRGGTARLHRDQGFEGAPP